MDLSPALRSALHDLGMVSDLSANVVDDSLSRYRRLGDLGRRGLAFYLLEVDERRLHDHFGHRDTYVFARRPLRTEATRPLRATDA